MGLYAISNVDYVCDGCANPTTYTKPSAQAWTNRKALPAPEHGKTGYTQFDHFTEPYTPLNPLRALKVVASCWNTTARSTLQHQQCRLCVQMAPPNPSTYTKPSAHTCTYIQWSQSWPQKKWENRISLIRPLYTKHIPPQPYSIP